MLKKVILGAVALTTALSSYGTGKVIYGEDDRYDLSEILDQKVVDFAKASATQIDKRYMLNVGDQTRLIYASLERVMGVCSDERFAKQNSIGRCSGFLVGDDVLVTAGHCVQGLDCSTYSWVFDYDNEEALDNTVPSSSVYNCKEVLTSVLEPLTKKDYAVVKLDRKVTGRTPLKFRKTGKPSKFEPLTIIGSPSGLLTKVTTNAYVVDNSHPEFFRTNADTFGGNSGSAVLNTQTGLVEGILVRGAKDYVWDPVAQCRRVNVCDQFNPMNGCYGESVSRIPNVRLNQYLK